MQLDRFDGRSRRQSQICVKLSRDVNTANLMQRGADVSYAFMRRIFPKIGALEIPWHCSPRKNETRRSQFPSFPITCRDSKCRHIPVPRRHRDFSRHQSVTALLDRDDFGLRQGPAPSFKLFPTKSDITVRPDQTDRALKALHIPLEGGLITPWPRAC